MIEAQWFMFLLAAVAVISTPGQDMLLVMSRSITHGTKAGIATAAGVSLGLLGHTLLATAGLGALLRTSEWLFTAIKLVGAAYLLYLGIQLLLTRSAQISAEASQPQSLTRQFITGAASNITNPKIAVFYFAFLPQFVVPGATNPTLSILALGLVFCRIDVPDQRACSDFCRQSVGLVSCKTKGTDLAVSLQWHHHDRLSCALSVGAQRRLIALEGASVKL